MLIIDNRENMKLSIWLERAIFINIILLILFVLSDYFVWLSIGSQLCFPTGYYSNLTTNPAYYVYNRVISIRGIHTNNYHTSIDIMAYMPNFPLLLFILTIILNTLLIFKITKDM